MATITIRNLDDDIVAALKKQAKARNRSLEAELREVLKQAAMQGARMADFHVLANRIAAMTPTDRPQTDSAELLHEDRDR